MLETAAKTSSHKRDVYDYLIGIKPNGSCDRIAAILRDLGGRPEFTLRGLILSGTIARLHGSMGHKRQLIFRRHVPARSLSGITGGVKARAFLRGRLLQRS